MSDYNNEDNEDYRLEDDIYDDAYFDGREDAKEELQLNNNSLNSSGTGCAVVVLQLLFLIALIWVLLL